MIELEVVAKSQLYKAIDLKTEQEVYLKPENLSARLSGAFLVVSILSTLGNEARSVIVWPKVLENGGVDFTGRYKIFGVREKDDNQPF